MDHSNTWSRHTDDRGRTYYHDPATGATSWHPPPPPSEAPPAPPLNHSNSLSNSAFHAYGNPYPPNPELQEYPYSFYPPYPPRYPYDQPPHRMTSHKPQTSHPHSSLPHSSYPSHSGSPQTSYPSPPTGAPPPPTGAPPPHTLPPSHAHPGPPRQHPPPGPPPSHPPPGPPPSHPPPGPPTSHASSSAHPPMGAPHLAPLPSHPPPGPPSSHAPPPPPGSHVPPYSAYPQAYHHQDPSGSPSSNPYPPPPEHHPSHAYPSHSSSYSTHSHMPPTHLANHPPQPGAYPHHPQHTPPPPPHGPPPSHPPMQRPQGYPSASNPQHMSSASHLPPNHQPIYHPSPSHQPSTMSHLSPNPSGISTAMSNVSLGRGPPAKFAQISLEFRAISLRDRDWIGKSDPIVNAYEPRYPTLDADRVTEWKLLGSTETIKNNVNPTWTKLVKARYYFERHQPLRFIILDVDNFKTMKGDHLGTANSTMAEIVRNGSMKLKLKNKTGGPGRGELIIRAHDDNPEGKVRLNLSFSGKGLDKKDLIGKSDPYYKLMRVMPGSGGTSLLYKSEKKMNDLNPTWKPHTLMLPVGSTPWEQVNMIVMVYDWDRYAPHDLIGEATFNLRELTTTKLFPIVNNKKKAKKGSRYKDSGELVVHRADALEMPSFISYLQGGLRLDFVVAVDFTASNKPVDNSQSLHYMGNPKQPSQYYQALHAVGTVLADYLSGGCITALGFGAKLPGCGEEASFDFALSGRPCAYVYGVQGLLDAYWTALSNVSLAGPTYFTPIIKNAMGVANSVPLSQTNQHFAVLLILTDGIITDLSLTIETIIEASQSTPISIVIVGVGKADFRAMKRLDADDCKLRSDRGDKEAKHDIVQFIKYDPARPIEDLASDVLSEVPPRVAQFMADAGIKPNPPVMQQPTY